MLPLLAVGPKLFVTTQLYKKRNMNELKRMCIDADEDIEEGNDYLNDAKEYREDIKLELKLAFEDLNKIKKRGVDSLFHNYKYLRDLYLNYYEEEIKEIIKNSKFLYISTNEVLNINRNIESIIDILKIDLEKYYEKNDDEVITNSNEVILGGIATATILNGLDLLSSISISPIILEPMIITSTRDVKKIIKSCEKAKKFKKEAFREKENWKTRLTHIKELTEFLYFYAHLVDELINLNKEYLLKIKNNQNSLIPKMLVVATYLNKLLTKYPSIDEYNIIENLDDIIRWIQNRAKREYKECEKIYDEIIKL